MRDELKKALQKENERYQSQPSQLIEQNVHAEAREPALFDAYKTKESIRND